MTAISNSLLSVIGGPAAPASPAGAAADGASSFSTMLAAAAGAPEAASTAQAAPISQAAEAPATTDLLATALPTDLASLEIAAEPIAAEPTAEDDIEADAEAAAEDAALVAPMLVQTAPVAVQPTTVAAGDAGIAPVAGQANRPATPAAPQVADQNADAADDAAAQDGAAQDLTQDGAAQPSAAAAATQTQAATGGIAIDTSFLQPARKPAADLAVRGNAEAAAPVQAKGAAKATARDAAEVATVEAKPAAKQDADTAAPKAEPAADALAGADRGAQDARTADAQADTQPTQVAETRSADRAFAAADVRSQAAVPASAPAQLVAVHMQRAGSSRLDHITVQLRPDDLGGVEVQLSFTRDNGVQAVIVADRPEALDLLQRDARTLERALADAGLKADSGSLSFSLRGEDRGGQDRQAREQGGRATRQADEIADQPTPSAAAIQTRYFRAPAGQIDIRI